MWRDSILANMEHLMTDPQDKAAIAALQAAVKDLQTKFESLQAGINSLLAVSGTIHSEVAALEQLHPPHLFNWPHHWPS